MPNDSDLIKNGSAKRARSVLLILAAALALRVFLAVRTGGYAVDTGNFFAWALRLAQTGFSGFYSPDYYADYPPGYMVVLWVVGKLMNALGLSYTSDGAVLLLDAAPIACDLALAYVIYKLASDTPLRRGAPLLCAIIALNPMMFFDSAVWNQVDSVFTLAMLGCFLALMREKHALSGLLFALALLIKTQALIFGPVFALCFLLPVAFEKGEARKRALTALLKAFSACMALLLAFSLLFQGSQGALWLYEKYVAAGALYPYASCNAFNLPALFGGQWRSDGDMLFFLPWRVWGALGIALVTALTAWFSVIAYKRRSERFPLLLLCAFYACGVFTLAHNMHERYLLPGVIFLFASFAITRERRLLKVALIMSATCTVNMAAVYIAAGYDPYLSSASLRLITALVSAANVAVFAYLAYVTYDICVRGRSLEIKDFERAPIDYAAIGRINAPAWSRRDTVFIAAITLVCAAASFIYLGDMKAPESGVAASDAVSGSVSFASDAEISGAFIFPGISQGELIITTDSGEYLAAQLDQNSSFTWTQVNADAPIHISAGESVNVTLSGGLELKELAFTDTQGNRIEPSDCDAAIVPLFDERELVPSRTTQLNSMYFDEIYHARTAYEHLHGLEVYETTHPPLGKVLIMFGVWLFGMNSFGWRFAGALFGVLMVPLMYLLARELLKKREWAALAAVVFAADFMRFAQTRIATIDVYVVFFIMLSSYFMLVGARRAVCEGFRAALAPIALSGAAFGCACASKWSGVYAGLGLCAIYFGALYARKKRLDAAGEGAAFGGEIGRALTYGAAFFVAVPIIIYIASYLPYFLRTDISFGLKDLIACQKSMYDYHSSPKPVHGFQSSWFSWPFIWRPIWYYQGKGLAAGGYSSIASLGSPLLWWGGLAALVSLAVRAARGRQGAAGAFVLISYAAQFLPWTLVTRSTFIYHYFACVPFLALALALALMKAEERSLRSFKGVRISVAVAAVALFVFFYPVLSGLTVSRAYAEALMLLPSWGFYIL